MRRAHGAAAILVAAAVLTLSAQSNAAGKLSRDWRRLASASFDVVGNASEGDLRRAADRIEIFRAVILTALPRLPLAGGPATRVYVFRDYSDFEKFAPRDGRGRRLQGVGGYFLTTPGINLLALPMYRDRESTYEAAFHEYTHYLVHKSLPNAPAWLNEGLADFYSTTEIDDSGKVTIGRAEPQNMATLQSRSIPPLRRLLSGDSAQRLFVGGDTEMFYAHSWLFVHYMLLADGGSHRPQLMNYLELLRSAPTIEAAASQAFGSLDDLDRELRGYIQNFKLPGLIIKGSLAARSNAPASPITESEAALLQGELLTALDAFDDARPLVEKALALAPQVPRARLMMGRIQLGEGSTEDGLQRLNALADEEPNDFEVHYYLADALDNAGRFADALKEFDRAVAIDKDSPEAWFGVSQAALSLHRDSQSDAAMRQVARLGGRPGWYYRQARAALLLGSNTVAARDVHQFLTSMGWADESGPYAAFVGVIAHWRLGETREADDLLRQAGEAAPPKTWVANVVDYLKGTLSDTEFLDRAKDNGQRTEAHAYIGFKRLQAGDREEALKHFQWVKERGEHNYTEYELAVGELKRLAS